MGFFPVGGVIDRIDVAISWPFFSMSLGKLEYVLAVPGTFFGTTTTSLGAVPMVLAALLEPTAPIVAAAVVAMMAGLYIFFQVVAGKMPRTALWAKPHLLIAICTATSYFAGGRRAMAVVSFYLCGWGVAQLVCQLFKTLGERPRPIAGALAKQLEGKIPRCINVHGHHKMGYTAIESFPSGDAVGAAVTSYLIHTALGGVWAWVPMVLGCWGRMYFWAHHFLDVTVGAAIGVGVCYLLEALVAPWDEWHLAHIIVVMLLFSASYKAIRRLRAALPPQYGEEHKSAGPAGPS